MATWEDGPEYAPRERPQYFADAPLPPLEQVPEPGRPADERPPARPRFDAPSAPVAPLETLVPEPADERDPSRPFDVVTATMTTESTWGSSWGSPAPGPGFPPPPTPGPPSQPSSPFPHVPQQDPYGYPVPGTPGWFAPPPTSYGEQQQPSRIGGKEVFEAASPGLCVCLAIGGLIYVLAPIMVVVAVFLSVRVQIAQLVVRMIFRIAAGSVGFFAVVGLYRSVIYGDPWWDFVAWWSVAICWVSLGVLLLAVWQGLRRPAAPTPPNPWG